jgi:hypothetical protein
MLLLWQAWPPKEDVLTMRTTLALLPFLCFVVGGLHDHRSAPAAVPKQECSGLQIPGPHPDPR